MKKKVIPLFLMLPYCRWFQSNITLSPGISRLCIMQEQNYIKGAVLNNSIGRPIKEVTLIVKVLLKQFMGKIFNYENPTN